VGKTATSTRVTQIVLFAAWFFGILAFVLGNSINRGRGAVPFFSPTPVSLFVNWAKDCMAIYTYISTGAP